MFNQEIFMRKKGSINRVIFAATILCAILLPAILPISAAAVDYSPLATIKSGLTYPIDAAVSDSGKIYIVDGLSKKILIYNNNYILSGIITSVGNPTAVAVYRDTVFVADCKTKSVKLFTGSGSVAGVLKKDGLTATFKLPRNIAVDSVGNVYVVDQFGDTIEVFDPGGNYSHTIVGLSMPQDAVAVGGKLVIIDQPFQNGGTNGDMRVSRVRLYDPGTGFTDNLFPSYGINTSNGQYISLKGIAADPHNNLYLDDSYLNVLYKFDIDGTFLGIIDEPVTTPLGTTVSNDGRLLVTSSYDGTVKVLGVDYDAGVDTWLNDTPVADAGPDQTIAEGTEFILNGSNSLDSDGIISYSWTQLSGINILPANPYTISADKLNLSAPDVGPNGSELVFELIVTDSKGKTSPPATTTVAVHNVIAGSMIINDGALYTNSCDVVLSLDAPEAVEMRLANDSEPFAGEYIPYSNSLAWTLSDYDPSVAVNNKIIRVEFRDAGGNISSAGSSILLDMHPPAAPLIIDAGGVPGQFNWNSVDDAVAYILEYAFNSEFIDSVNLTGPYPNGLAIDPADLAYGTWYWRVRTIDAAGNMSPWSDVATFATAPDCSVSPEPPLLANPFDGATGVSRTVTLLTNSMIYNSACGTHLRTEWQIGRDADFSTLIMDIGTTLDNLTEYPVPPLVLEPAVTYFWRVKQTADNDKQSDWSEIWEFTTVDQPDEMGADGVLYIQPEDSIGSSDEEISIKTTVGDSNVKIKSIRVSSGVTAQTVKELDPAAIDDAADRPASFPLGLLSFRLLVEPGAPANVEISFTGPVPDDAEWYIYDANDGWHTYNDAVFSRNRRTLTLNFVDGGAGDADGVINGIIVNP